MRALGCRAAVCSACEVSVRGGCLHGRAVTRCLSGAVRIYPHSRTSLCGAAAALGERWQLDALVSASARAGFVLPSNTELRSALPRVPGSGLRVSAAEDGVQATA